MALGHKTGGRITGTPNRKTTEVAALLESLNCNPIEGMVQIAQNPDASLELRGKLFSDLAKYVYPHRKAIEHSGEVVAVPVTLNIIGVPTPAMPVKPDDA
ncbi:MAG: hypothetical protein M3N41_14185 [Acidobacteriota bacterium]|nr:hypothetical protein [Acidobacteriota bacterium]